MTWQGTTKRSAAPDYKPGDKVYLDASNIQTTRTSKKLSHKCLGPFVVERQVGNCAYHLRLPLSMSCLHLVFNVVRLTPAPNDPLPGRCILPPLLPEIIDSEEEWVVKEILDRKMINRRLWYLVKWKDFGIKHNSWEPWDNVHAPDLVADFYRKNPGAARHIRSVEFQSILFKSVEVPRCHFLEGGVDVRRHSVSPKPTTDFPLYIPPHHHTQPLSPFRGYPGPPWACLQSPAVAYGHL